MRWLTNLGGRSRALLAGAAVLVVAGVVVLVVAVRSQQSAPEPSGKNYTPSDLAGPSSTGTASVAPSSGPSSAAPRGTTPKSGVFPIPTNPAKNTPLPGAGRIHGPILSAAKPVSITIPAIGVTSTLLTLGLDSNHAIQVPPLERDSKAGWYKYSPEPGTLGPAVILGHIDSAAYGPGVFFKLGALHKGDTVSVTRSDHTVAVFRVDGVSEYKKIKFPTDTVYGNTDNAALRLITCGGTFDESTRNYEDNIVVFASLVSSHPAS